MKNIILHGVLCLSLLLTSCAPVAELLEDYAQESRRQREVQSNPPILRAECIARDRQTRINRLQQGPNACFVTGVVSPALGEIRTARVVVRYLFASTYQDFTFDFIPTDQAWFGQRFGVWLPLLMPDSLTGAVFATLAGFTGFFYNEIGRPVLIYKASQWFQVPQDIFNLPYLDYNTAFQDAGRRFSNLGTRPDSVVIQARMCSDVCTTSPVLQVLTR